MTNFKKIKRDRTDVLYKRHSLRRRPSLQSEQKFGIKRFDDVEEFIKPYSSLVSSLTEANQSVPLPQTHRVPEVEFSGGRVVVPGLLVDDAIREVADTADSNVQDDVELNKWEVT